MAFVLEARRLSINKELLPQNADPETYAVLSRRLRDRCLVRHPERECMVDTVTTTGPARGGLARSEIAAFHCDYIQFVTSLQQSIEASRIRKFKYYRAT